MNHLTANKVLLNNLVVITASKRASTRENLSLGVCEQHRRRPACASVQSDQRLCYTLIGKVSYVNLLQVKFEFSSYSVAENGFETALSETRKTGFLSTRPILQYDLFYSLRK